MTSHLRVEGATTRRDCWGNHFELTGRVGAVSVLGGELDCENELAARRLLLLILNVLVG